MDDRIDAYIKVAEGCDYELKKAVTVWVFRHLVAHARESGTYRYLIYERLGFGSDSYADLFDGLTISNTFEQASEAKGLTKLHKITLMKSVFVMCDEPSCFEDATEYGPPGDGVLQKTCIAHRHLTALK